MAVVKSLVIGGEAFVQPDVAPVFAGDEVAEPLMREFVGDQAFARTDIFGGAGKERIVSQGGATGVFHASFHEIVDADLVILGPRIGNSNLVLEKPEHVFGITER